MNVQMLQWRIQDFHFVFGMGGGGGEKEYVRARTSRAQSPKYGGPQPLGLLMRSRAIWALLFFL